MTTVHRKLLAALAAAAVALGAAPARADDSPPRATAASRAGDKLAAARTRIAAGDWRGAVDELERARDPASADWNNLMGYSLRKGRAPDYAAAERYYDEALRIDPKHRGALEYSGELYLMTDRLPQAEQRLAALDRACFLPCEEYADLKKAVAEYKARGAAAGASAPAR